MKIDNFVYNIHVHVLEKEIYLTILTSNKWCKNAKGHNLLHL